MLTTIVNFVGGSDMSSPEYWAGCVEYFAHPVTALLFVVVLVSLLRQETALCGSKFEVARVAIALVPIIFVALVTQDAGATTVVPMSVTVLLIAGCTGLGMIIGLYKAKTVQMTGMPELIALLHSFVGSVAVLVSFGTLMELSTTADLGLVTDMGFHLGKVGIGILIKAVASTGSIIACLKLSGRMKGKPLTLLEQNSLSVLMLLAIVTMIVWMIAARRMVETVTDPVMLEQQWIALGVLAAVSLVLGLHLVAAVGGGDMPTVASMLSSYFEWAVAAVGFVLSNPLLITVGALAGSSGTFLSHIIYRGMGRSFVSVILGGSGEGAGSVCEAKEYGEYHEIKASETADLLKGAKFVVITPGHGMATAGAQSTITDSTKKLCDLGVQVRFGTYPVAGRLSGYMNMLLTEIKVPYDIVLGMDEINSDFPDADVVLVIGTNDTVNPDTHELDSLIVGMSVLYMWEAGRVIVFKYSMAIGYAGIQNPLFFKENIDMLFGDAKASVEEIIKNLQLGCGGGSEERPGVVTAFSSQLNTYVALNS